MQVLVHGRLEQVDNLFAMPIANPCPVLTARNEQVDGRIRPGGSDLNADDEGKTASNKAVLDYVLLPTDGKVKRTIRFSEAARERRAITCFKTADALVRAIHPETNQDKPCFPTHASAVEQATESKPAQNQERPRAALIERR
ncbi:hypothetical protein [Bradyrhizobium sp. AZCC 2230]|uniref:hypothetical protein n=1 Tax=Bradyrhizobium sp. AZCC 2230 TaxID=3117021 RepID=UPI002FF420BE